MIQAASRIATVAFDGHVVTVTRPKGGLGVDQGTRTYPIGQIAGIQWRPAGLMSSGYLRLVVPGVADVRHRKGGTVDLLRDELSVPFGKGQQAAFEKVRAVLEQALAQQNAGPAQSTSGSLADELGKLQALVQAGALTAAEFEQAKARLLG